MAKSKKGAEMTVGTIVIIVLALIVLVVLVLGFTGGWGNLWGRITNFFGGANVDSIVQACQMACTTNAKYDYCDRDRTVSADTAVFKVEKKDNKPKDDNIVNPKSTTVNVIDVKKGKATCKELADWYGSLGFQSCEGLCSSGGNGNDLAAKCKAISDLSKCIDNCRIDDTTGMCVPA